MWLLFILSILSYATPTQPILGVNLTIADFFYMLMFYLIIIYRMSLKVPLFPLISKKFIAIWYILLFIGIGSMLSLMRSTNVVESISNLLQYIFIFFVLLTVIEFLINKKLSNAIKIVGLFLIPSIFYALLVLASKFGIYNSLDSTIISLNGRYRGFSGIATAFGNNMASNFAIALYFLRSAKNPFIKLIMLITSVSLAYAALLSGSFGAILILFIAIIGFLWFGSKYKNITRIFVFFIAFCTLFLYYQIEAKQNYTIFQYAPEILEERFQESNNNFGSSDIRSTLMELGMKEFLANPLIGVGYSQFKYYNIYGASVHNTFISAAVEMGIFGLIGIILYVFLPFIQSRKIVGIFKQYYKEFIFINFLSLYALIRLGVGMKSQEFINREPWIPILIIFVLYAYKSELKNIEKNKP